MTIRTTSDRLFALMDIEPIEKLETIDMTVYMPSPRWLTAQERQWLEEAKQQGEFA